MPGYGAHLRTVNSEKAQIFIPNGWQGNGTRRGIVWCHGSGQDALAGAALGLAYAEVADTVVISGDLTGTPGGQYAWGNDSSLAKVTAHWNTLKSEYGVKTDKMVIAGFSMGTATALMYTLLNPANVQAIELELPAFSVDDIHDNDRLSQQAFINTSYVNDAGWEAAKTGRDAALNHAAWNALNIPMQVHAGATDTVCLVSFARNFVAAVDQVEYIENPSLGHDANVVNVAARNRFFQRHV